jgi:ribosomal protein L7/L12
MSEAIDVEKICREAIANGSTPDEAVLILHSRGASLLASIKAIRTVCSLSLGEAKRVVSEHRVWTAEVSANRSLHETAEAIASEDKGEKGYV